MFSYYKNFKIFLDEYPRFKISSISFDMLKTRIKRLKAWFSSEQCLQLPPTDVCSKTYWKNDAIHLRNPTDAIDFDHNQTFKHEGIHGEGEVDIDYKYVTESATETDGDDGGNGSEHDSLNDMNDMKNNLPGL